MKKKTVIHFEDKSGNNLCDGLAGTLDVFGPGGISFTKKTVDPKKVTCPVCNVKLKDQGFKWPAP